MAVHIVQRGNSFAAQVTVAPYPRVTQSFKIPGRGKHTAKERKETEAAANAWARDEERRLQDFKNKKQAPAKIALTVATLIEGYLESPKTKQLASYADTEARLGFWLEHFGQEKVIEFYRDGHIFDGQVKLAKSGKAPATVNRYLAAMSSAWSWGQAAAKISHELVWPRKGLKMEEPPAREVYVTDAQRDALLAAALETDPMMYAMITIALATGIRQGNLLTLTWSQVDFEQKKINLPKTKNGRSHSVHMLSWAVTALDALKGGSEPKPKDFVFKYDGKDPDQDNVIWRFEKLRKAAGIPGEGEDKVTFHTLRHSCASYLAQAGASLLEIGTVLGHRSQQTTQRYAHIKAGNAVTGSAAVEARLSGTKSA